MPYLHIYNYRGERLESRFFEREITHKDIKDALKDQHSDSYVSIASENFDEEAFLERINDPE